MPKGERFPARPRSRAIQALWLAAVLLAGGCSVRGLAVNALANALAASGDVFASDEDPELIREATPFALKTTEALLAEKPDHPGLLLAACRGFTQYSYAFVQRDAERIEDEDFEAAERGYERALKLYLRARDYCLRALEGMEPGIRRRLEVEPGAAVASFGLSDVPLLYWTGASWGAAISMAVDRPEINVDLPAAEALLVRALELDETYDGGSVHELMIALEGLPETMGGSPARARTHFARAVELSGGKRPGPYVALAQSVLVRAQLREEFVEVLERALKIDLDAEPSRRLANRIAADRALWLLERVDELFL